MKKLLTSALLAMVVLAGCKKDDPQTPATAFDGPEAVEVAYGGSVDLNTLFSANGVGGEFVYTLAGQPEYMSYPETGGQYALVDADGVYSVEGSTLTSEEVRVPDELPAETYAHERLVLQGKLKVELKVGGAVVDSEEYDIVQTDKPALQYEISYVDNNALVVRPDGNRDYNLVLGQDALPLHSLFNIDPIDYQYDPTRIFVMTNQGATYINESSLAIKTAEIRESGVDATGDFVVAFFLSPRGESETDEEYNARRDAAYAEALEAGSNRVYVNVTYVEADAVIGIVAHEDAIGNSGTASFWRNNANGRQVPSNFVLMKLSSGDTRPYDSSKDEFTIMAGEFDEFLEGRTTEFTPDYPGWWSHVALKLSFTDLDVDCPVGTLLQFKVSVQDKKDNGGNVIETRFLQPEWTVTIDTDRKAGNPAAL